MFAFIVLVALAPAAASPVQIERLDENTFLMSAPLAARDGASYQQARLITAAGQACGKARPAFGRYRFAEENGKRRFEQELLCLSPDHKLDIAATSAALEPSRADQQAVLAASYAYFAAKDQGRYPQAHALLTERARARFPLAAWADSARDFNAEAGASRGRRVVEITWYRDPQDAPEPGLYAAADFSADFDKLEFVCGYLMWQVQPDGGLRLMREEQNMAPRRSSGRALAPIDRDPLRTRMGCKD